MPLRLATLTVVVASLVLLSCGDEPPTQPARASGKGVKIELRSPAGATQLLMAEPDTTTEECQEEGRCVIQDRVHSNEVRVYCDEGEGECGTGTYGWELLTPPPGTQVAFNPSTTEMDQWTTMSIQTDSATPTGVTESEVNSIPLNGSPPAEGELEYPVHVQCSVYFNNCPILEIVDVLRDVVISPPDPHTSPTAQTTIIGKKVHLEVRIKEGSGSETYELGNNPLWTVEGHQDTSIVEDYDLKDGELELLPETLEDEEIEYYYVVPNDGYDIEVEAEVQAASVNHKVTTEASFNVDGPTNLSMTSVTASGGPSIGPVASAPGTWLRFGIKSTPLGPLTAGIGWTFTASMPSGDNGHVVGTQLAKSATIRLPPRPSPNTSGAYWLDACPTYGDATAQQGMQYQWIQEDSPAALLAAQDTLVSAADTLKMHFMYRPAGQESIWVPIGRMTWFWNATARRTGPQAADWDMVFESASVNPTGTTASEFPVWPEVFLEPDDPDDCGSFPD